MSNQIKADIALLLVTVGWGSSFILTKNALGDLSAFNFLALRFSLAFVLAALVFYKRFKSLNKQTLLSGVLVGAILFTGYAFQTVGLNYTSVSNSAFITGFSVILVPLISALLFKNKIPPNAILGTVLALLGLSLLTLNGKLALGIGDMLTFICTFAFAMHIITVGHLTSKVDSILLGIIQIGIVGFLSTIATFLFEAPIIPTQLGVWTNLAVLAVLCTAGAFIVQSVAQQYTSATHTALIYTGEPVFAAIFAYFMVGELLSLKGLLGACMVVTGMLVAELDPFKLLRKTLHTESARNIQ
ncbi:MULTISPECIES: DMT family transporter [unclassified Fusibacter]|uniref:DMT family transporter n=1 Tax=unclassified Fusibacter TaxID=2624464 RepID=UPI0010108F8F|nr:MULTISPECIES: DMT family transporter [unclassified Fusibacter]MCK8059198.1 DMT family transporter [Fusibacter sp. A2]NPE22609.1 DMT family transporter [Fusibacter sp. A1]RXV60709.1 DMT family transporter [Fusibacter sp. A1]